MVVQNIIQKSLLQFLVFLAIVKTNVFQKARYFFW